MTVHKTIMQKRANSFKHYPHCTCTKCEADRHSVDCQCKTCQAAELEAESAYRRRKRRRRSRRRGAIPSRRSPSMGRRMVRRALAKGVRDERRLTDMVFYYQNPRLPKGYRIKKGQRKLRNQWISIRNKIVRPLLKLPRWRRKKVIIRPVNVTYYNTPATTTLKRDDYYQSDEETHTIEDLRDEAKPKPGAINKSRTPRKASQIDSVVLHQMAFSRGADLRKYLKVTAHYIIMNDGQVGQLHNRSTYLNASNGFNRRSIAIEFAGNFPDIHGRYWKPRNKSSWMKNVVTQKQINAGRYLLKYLKKKNPNIRFVYSHRQSSGIKSNDPGPDIWRGVGEYAIRKLGYDADSRDHVIGTGKSIPKTWR